MNLYNRRRALVYKRSMTKITKFDLWSKRVPIIRIVFFMLFKNSFQNLCLRISINIYFNRERNARLHGRNFPVGFRFSTRVFQRRRVPDWHLRITDIRVVSHISKFGDASKSPVGDTASSAGDAESPSGDAHPPYSHSHLLQETPHLQIEGHVTLLFRMTTI